MIIRIETQWTTTTTEFVNSDISMEQIVEAMRGMLVTHCWQIETINKYLKTEDEV
jgi:L-rhamnose isomerase